LSRDPFFSFVKLGDLPSEFLADPRVLFSQGFPPPLLEGLFFPASAFLTCRIWSVASSFVSGDYPIPLADFEFRSFHFTLCLRFLLKTASFRPLLESSQELVPFLDLEAPLFFPLTRALKILLPPCTGSLDRFPLLSRLCLFFSFLFLFDCCVRSIGFLNWGSLPLSSGDALSAITLVDGSCTALGIACTGLFSPCMCGPADIAP